MFGVLLSVTLVPAVVSIIVTDPPPTSTEYNYSYNVVDPRTGDTKSLHEVRRGDVVTGSYSVLDPDGTQRVVKYTADSKRGFNAVVHSEPLAVPIHHAVRDRFYFPRGNTRYVNEYYSSHTFFRDHPTPQPDVRELLTTTPQPASMPSSNQSRQRNNDMADNRQTRYFTPSNQFRSSPPMAFKRGEYFAPNN